MADSEVRPSDEVRLVAMTRADADYLADFHDGRIPRLREIAAAFDDGIDSAEYAHMRAFIRDDADWMHFHRDCGDDCPAKTLPPKLGALDAAFPQHTESTRA